MKLNLSRKQLHKSSQRRTLQGNILEKDFNPWKIVLSLQKNTSPAGKSHWFAFSRF
jgi:hypothetical protein